VTVARSARRSTCSGFDAAPAEQGAVNGLNLKVLFAVVGKAPGAVTSADVLGSSPGDVTVAMVGARSPATPLGQAPARSLQ
jgi:hypothetical protein